MSMNFKNWTSFSNSPCSNCVGYQFSWNLKHFYFWSISGPKLHFLIPFNPFFDPQWVQILKNGPHFQIRHVQIVSGTNFHEIWRTFIFCDFWTFKSLLIPFLTPKGSKFRKFDLIFEFAMVKIGLVPIFMKFEEPLSFVIFGLFNPF